MKRHHRKAEANAKAKAKAKAPPRPTARKQLEMLKNSIATAVTQLREVKDDVGEIDSFIFVCIAALRAQRGDDMGPDVAVALESAYEKLALDVNRKVRAALEALGQDGLK
jgi:hypothetical protein